MKELIKRLRMQAKLTKHYCPTAKIPTLEENAANAIEKLEAENERLKNGVTVQEWISVKDRLPEPGERVLVCIGAVFEAFIDSAGKWQRYYSAPLNEVLGEPTHWMPLPQPPKGE